MTAGRPTGAAVRRVMVAALAMAMLGACSDDTSTPDVTRVATVNAESAPPVTPEPAPTTEAAVEVTAGTREAPLAVGEARKVSEVSAWTVALTAGTLDGAGAIRAADEYAPAPAEGESFVVGTFSVTVDQAAIAEQGSDLANDGADPGMSLFFSFVAADGTSFDGTSGTSCYTSNMLYSQGAVYADGATVVGDVCVAVPTDKTAGGLWRVSNMVNEAVWITAP